MSFLSAATPLSSLVDILGTRQLSSVLIADSGVWGRRDPALEFLFLSGCFGEFTCPFFNFGVAGAMFTRLPVGTSLFSSLFFFSFSFLFRSFRSSSFKSSGFGVGNLRGGFNADVRGVCGESNFSSRSLFLSSASFLPFISTIAVRSPFPFFAVFYVRPVLSLSS